MLIGSKVSPGKCAKPSFATVLEQTLNKETYTKAWCPSCKKYERMTQLRQLLSAPWILNLNANIMDQTESELWCMLHSKYCLIILADPSWLPKRFVFYSGFIFQNRTGSVRSTRTQGVQFRYRFR